MCVCWVNLFHDLFLFHWFFWVLQSCPHLPPPPSNLPLCAPPIRLQWTITALWGVDTFSCSSICGVVINFLSVIGLSYNILRLEAARSPAINHEKKRQKHHFSCIILNYSEQLWSKETMTRWPVSIKKTWGSFVCYRLLQSCVFPGHYINCTITLSTYATYKDNWFPWSMSIDPTEVSSMKLILFIVYKQHRRSPEEDAVLFPDCLHSSTDVWRERVYQLPSWPQLHSLLFCLYQIKLQCYSREI